MSKTTKKQSSKTDETNTITLDDFEKVQLHISIVPKRLHLTLADRIKTKIWNLILPPHIQLSYKTETVEGDPTSWLDGLSSH